MNLTPVTIIEAKYIGPTDTKGSRVRLLNVSTGERRIIPYGYDYNNTTDIAVAYLVGRGFKPQSATTTTINHTSIIVCQFTGADL